MWSEPQSRGRLNRPRLEWFVQSALQAETGEDIDIGRLYAGYRRCVDGAPLLYKASAQLSFLNRFADHYKELATGAGGSPIAVFGRRISNWDASPTHALALRIAASGLSESAQVEIFDSIESYLVRRAVCGLSRKNYNKVFAQQLKKMMVAGLEPQTFRESLAEATGDGSRWPRDEEFRQHWTTGRIYPGRLDAAKLRAIFHRLETVMRSEKTEESVPLALDSLDIDHILPQSWYTHWPLSDNSSASLEEFEAADQMRFVTSGLDPRMEEIVNRDSHVPRIGNLTMVHYGVNRSLQNYDFEAKRQAFFEHSHLQLNRALTNKNEWDETAIQERSEMLFEFAKAIWKGPV